VKGFFCLACGDIRGLLAEDAVACRCGRCVGGWDDPRKGLAWFYAEDRERMWALGFDNRFLMHPGSTWEAHHVWETADGSYFKSMESPVVKFKPGFTGDTRWVDFEELRAQLAP
jgi:hypothetical protein